MSPLPDQPPAALCLIRLSAIGDCCHTLPVVRTLQAAWPDTRITWIIGRTEHTLLRGCAGIEFITFDKSAMAASLRSIRRQLRGRDFPLLLHMHASMRANLVSRVVPASVRLGFDRPRARDWQWLFSNRQIAPRPEAHVMEGLFGFPEALGIEQRVLRWDIPLDPGDREFATSLRRDPRPLCVISPLSSQRFRNYRNWPVERFIATARYLRDRHDAELVLTGGNTPIEADYGAQISAALGGRIHNLIGRTTLKRLLAIIGEAELLICPDSGPAHMATAAGTPVIGLYASSNPARTGPWLSRHLVVDCYPQAVAQEFGTGKLRFGKRVRNPEAMSLITVDMVTERIDQVLGPAAR